MTRSPPRSTSPATRFPYTSLFRSQAGCLGDEGHRAAGARVDLQDVDLLAAHGELHVHQADDAERPGELLGLAPDLLDDGGSKAVGRQRAGGIAGVDAGLFDAIGRASCRERVCKYV